MDNRDLSRHPFEPTQDELPPKPKYHFSLHRRKFFQLTGGGLVVVFALRDMISSGNETAASQKSSSSTPTQVNAWIHIAEDGTVNVYTGKVQVGQNIRTSLSQIVAEELMVPLASFPLIMGDTIF